MGLDKRPARALALVALVFASTAQAGEPPSGAAWTTTWTTTAIPFEAQATAVASSTVGRPVSVECVGAASWHALGHRLGFDPAISWAVTTFHWDSELVGPAPDRAARFSPRACRFGASFWLDRSDYVAKTCRAAQQRARKTGLFTLRDGATCDLWASRMTAVHVLGHESVHLRGVHEESPADCVAVQIDAWVAMALGADEVFARSMAREYWKDFHLPLAGMYQSAECRDGGRLDLFPDSAGWPTPQTYPANLDAAFSAFMSELQVAGSSPVGTSSP